MGMLVLAIVKAAIDQRSARQVANAISNFFRSKDVDATKARCVLRSLHYIRLYQTGYFSMPVPHFGSATAPKSEFWVPLDLLAVANRAARVGCSRDALIYLESHLAQKFPHRALCC